MSGNVRISSVTRALLAVALATIVIGLASTASAQTPDPMQRLGAAKTVRCEFRAMASGDWTDGVPHSASRSSSLALRFEAVDVEAGIAQAVGPFGPSELNVRLTVNSLHFMQSFREGPLYLTTVIGRPAANGRWPAVHTRHEFTDVSVTGYTSRPEQYYGSCTVEP